MPKIGEVKTVAPAPKAQRPVWGVIETMKPGEGIFVTGYSKKALSRVRDRFKAVGVRISVHKDVEGDKEGYTIRRLEAA